MRQYGFFRSNTSFYLSKNRLERFNQDPNLKPFISNFQEVLAHAIYLEKQGKFSSLKMKRKFDKYYWARNVNPFDPLLICTYLEPEIYLNLQYLLKDMTKRYWKMDELLNLFIYWFLYTYGRNIRKLPFIKRKYKKKNPLLIKFNKKFSKFYKNINLEY